MRLINVLVLAVVLGLQGCAGFDHSKNDFVIGKTTCAEIARQVKGGTKYPDNAGGVTLQYKLSENNFMLPENNSAEQFQHYDCDRDDILEGMYPFKGVRN